MTNQFELVSPFKPTGDQPAAIVLARRRCRLLLCRLYPRGAARPRPGRRRLCQPRLQRYLRGVLPRGRASAG